MKKLIIFSIYFISTTLIFFSCSDKNIINEQEELKGEQVFKHEIGISSFYNLGEYILLKMNKKVGYGLSLYNKDNLEKPLVNFCLFGDGPDEWGAIRVNGQTVRKNDTDYLVLNDAFKNRVRLLNIDRLIKDSVEVYDFTYQFDSKHGMTQALNFIEDSLIVSTSGIDAWEHGRLKFYDMSKDSSWVVPLFPKVEYEELSPFDEYSLYFSYIHYNKEKKLIASTMDAFDRVDIFSIKGELISTYIGNSDLHITKNPLKVEGIFKPYPVYYKHSTSSNKYIYGLFYDQLFTEIEKIEIKPQIKVFDWNGSIVRNFIVKEYLSNIEVYEDDSFLLGIDKQNEKVMKYDLSALN